MSRIINSGIQYIKYACCTCGVCHNRVFIEIEKSGVSVQNAITPYIILALTATC